MGSRCREGRTSRALGGLLALLVAAGSAAAVEEAGHRVSFRVSRAQDVSNDRVEAVLVAPD